MKMLLTIALLIITLAAFPQGKIIHYPNRQSLNNNTADPAALSKELTASCKTGKEKVSAIFHWIADNISYYRPNIKGNKKNTGILNCQPETAGDTAGLKPLTERIAGKVLCDKKAVCDGYARLFKSLCDHAGIESVIITGYARNDMDSPGAKFRSNHSWNAVYFDSSWHLLDVTWASGFISYSTGEFIQQYNDYYFLTPPEQFVRHHLPDDIRWTLLNSPPVMDEFRYAAFKQRSFSKYMITSFSPSKGIINASVGDTIRLELETISHDRNLNIVPDSLWEQSSLVQSPLFAYINPETSSGGSKVYYSFPVTSASTQWLYLMYNNDAVLRYRLNIRKEKQNELVKQ